MNVAAIIAAALMFYVGRRYGEHKAADRMRHLIDEVRELSRQVGQGRDLRLVDRDPD